MLELTERSALSEERVKMLAKKIRSKYFETFKNVQKPIGDCIEIAAVEVLMGLRLDQKKDEV